ncbi:MAG: ATP-binding cassette domain-containing protein [Flavobacteriales bacterium]|nr:ATP-binding cassette domain-containing protein [Flavobacteriales bacterium]
MGARANDIVVQVEGVGKRYRLGMTDRRQLVDEFKALMARLRGKPDPTAKVGAATDGQRIGEYFWALRDVGFEVRRGEVLGIIGRNGAGKSTLLKLLSRITAPTEGAIGMRGKVTSLLEVGTGFHPELTGRQNIYLNGTIMGMRKADVTRHEEEIIAFSGIEHHIDTPIKRYSSGMKVRLGFAVAAHLDPDILILDEVLAVGDAEFQKKCLDKMREVTSKEGRTVLFVSHNMAAMKSLCHRAIVLEKGRVVYTGETAGAVNYYMKGDAEVDNYRRFGDAYDLRDFKLIGIHLNPVGGSYEDPLDEYSEIELHVHIEMKDDAARLKISLLLSNEEGIDLFVFTNGASEAPLREGYNHLICTLPKGFLNVGGYSLSFYLVQDNARSLHQERDVIKFHVQEGQRDLGRWMGKELGFIKPRFEWKYGKQTIPVTT